MSTAKTQTSKPKSSPSSEKLEGPNLLDRAARLQKLEEDNAFVCEALARFPDVMAFSYEIFRQILARRNELPTPVLVRAFQSLEQCVELMNAAMASWARQEYETSQKFLQLSQDYAREAAEENDPDSKQRLKARSKTMALKAAALKKNADKLNQWLLTTQNKNVVSPAASHPQNQINEEAN